MFCAYVKHDSLLVKNVKPRISQRDLSHLWSKPTLWLLMKTLGLQQSKGRSVSGGAEQAKAAGISAEYHYQ